MNLIDCEFKRLTGFINIFVINYLLFRYKKEIFLVLTIKTNKLLGK